MFTAIITFTDETRKPEVFQGDDRHEVKSTAGRKAHFGILKGSVKSAEVIDETGKIFLHVDKDGAISIQE
jgi:hypothetical protein